jgi:hypothetical protein
MSKNGCCVSIGEVEFITWRLDVQADIAHFFFTGKKEENKGREDEY